MDEIAYERLFDFLNEKYNFKPKFIITDFEKSFSSCYKKNKYAKDNTIHLKCMFHFSQILKLSKLGFFKRKLNKQAIEIIIRNAQLLAFIKKDNLNKPEKIELNEIVKYRSLSKFKSYLKNFIFK